MSDIEVDTSSALVDKDRARKIVDFFYTTYNERLNCYHVEVKALENQFRREHKWLLEPSDSVEKYSNIFSDFLVVKGVPEYVAWIQQLLSVMNNINVMLYMGKDVYISPNYCRWLKMAEDSMCLHKE